MGGPTGTAIVNLELSADHRGCSASCATAIHALKDSSAVVVLGRSGRVLHVSSRGAILEDIRMAEYRTNFLAADIGTQGTAVDRDRRLLWFERPSANSRGTELVEIDFTAPHPTLRVLSADVISGSRLAPDLSGGVWLVSHNDVRRIDRNGRTVVKRALAPP